MIFRRSSNPVPTSSNPLLSHTPIPPGRWNAPSVGRGAQRRHETNSPASCPPSSLRCRTNRPDRPTKLAFAPSSQIETMGRALREPKTRAASGIDTSDKGTLPRGLINPRVAWPTPHHQANRKGETMGHEQKPMTAEESRELRAKSWNLTQESGSLLQRPSRRLEADAPAAPRLLGTPIREGNQSGRIGHRIDLGT